jgi:hypothetical protein
MSTRSSSNAPFRGDNILNADTGVAMILTMTFHDQSGRPAGG